MASGRTHELINLLFLPPALYFVPRELYLPFTAGYMVGTFILSPDIDMKHSKPSKRWKILRCVWFPYQKVSRHRGISHTPVIGSLIRLFYLVLLSIFLYFVILGVISLLKPELLEPFLNLNPINYLHSVAGKEASAYFIFGVILSDITHVILDVLSSKLKRLRRL